MWGPQLACGLAANIPLHFKIVTLGEPLSTVHTAITRNAGRCREPPLWDFVTIILFMLTYSNLDPSVSSVA